MAVKRMIAGLLTLVLLLCGAAALGEDYCAAEGNDANLCALLEDLAAAYEEPSEQARLRIDADLSAIRDVSEADHAVASAIASNWADVYLDDYPLFMHAGGERAVELEAADLPFSDAHAIVVLGYALKDGEMTGELMGRCDAAAALARSLPGAILVCSGGATGENNPFNHTEAGLMRDYLVAQCGIGADRICVDERAMTTVDNAVNTFAILRDRGIRTMTIVTSSYHQRWGQVIYNAVGLMECRKTGYAVESVGNYCYETEPSSEVFRRDDRIAARQLARVLNLQSEPFGQGR